MRGTKNITQAANDIKVTVAQHRDISLSGTEQTLQTTDGRIAHKATKLALLRNRLDEASAKSERSELGKRMITKNLRYSFLFV